MLSEREQDMAGMVSAAFMDWCPTCGMLVGGVTLGNLKHELKMHLKIHDAERRLREVDEKEEETLP